MRVSTDSWHWRWLRSVYTAERNNFVLAHLSPRWVKDGLRSDFFKGPKDLCSYFWALVFSPLVLLPWVALALLAWGMTGIAYAGIALGQVAIAVAEGARRGYRAVRRLPPPRTKPGAQSNLVIEYLRARKRKVCPLIEYDYGDD